jgi:hypothetical protein
MNIPTKLKRTLMVSGMSAVGTIGIALAATPAAFAHSMPSNSQSAHTASSQSQQQNQQKNNGHDPSWNWWHRGPWNKPSCQQIQTAMNQKVSATVPVYKKQLTGLGIMLSGIQTSENNGDITINNYDALNATVTNDQATSTADVNAITAPQLDCNNASGQDESNAQNQLNSSIQKAQKDMAAYRHDLMNLFQAAVNS